MLTIDYSSVIGSEKELDKVKWASKRGMLELDLILEPYVDHAYQNLNLDDKKAFLALLACEDQDLFCWFIKSHPADIEHTETVDKVLSFKRAHQAKQAG
jgi:antitoxin CptB